MLQNDRTLKGLLAVIALLLAVIALRPLIDFGGTAHAQDSRGSSGSSKSADSRSDVSSSALPSVTAGYRLSQVGVITSDKRLPIEEMQSIDSAQALAVRYSNNQIVVYRVERVGVTARGIVRD